MTTDSRDMPVCHDGKEIAVERYLSLQEDIEKNIQREAIQKPAPELPYSVFSSRMKRWIIFLVSISALISPFGATTILPALNVLTDVLDITPTKANISITSYMIAQAIAPAVIGAMSDTSGRRLSFILCYVIYIVANIGLALQTNYVALLILRMVQAVGCSAAIALAFAIVSDISTSAERGKYMGYAGAGILCGPAFGPSIGGILAQYLGWRSIFWFLAIFSGVLLVVFIFLFPETCRNMVGNGSTPARGISQSIISCIQQRKLAKQSALTEGDRETRTDNNPVKSRISLNPLATFRILGEKESCIILLYNGFFFTGMMMTTSAIPDLFKQAYNLKEIHIGLCYIANGIGSLLSSLIMGHIVDWNFRRHAARLNIPISNSKQQDLSNFPIERVKLEIVLPGHVVGIIGLVMFGWTVRFQTHLVGPEIALFVTGFGISTAFNITNGLLIDLHRDKPAAATAAINFVRCLMSAGGSAAIIPMCTVLNPGWTFTLIGLVYIVLIGVVVLIMQNGLQWRQNAAEATVLEIGRYKENVAEDHI